MEKEPGSTSGTMTAWLTDTIARYAQVPAGEIDGERPLSDYGLNSISAFAIITDIEDAFGVVPEVTVVWDYPTVNALSAFMTGLVEQRPEP